MKLVIVSGRSGSGKSTALHVLEDLGFNSIDNLPAALLPALVETTRDRSADSRDARLAVGIDARNLEGDLQRFADIVLALDRADIEVEILFLDASADELVKRFSETRRKHPLSGPARGLREALEFESELLEHIADLADLTIDTTRTTPMALRELIRTRIVGRAAGSISLQFTSFGFKHGVPVDADFVFDARCLPNPHWVPALRRLTGRDAEVRRFLAGEPEVDEMFEDIRSFLDRWLPRFEAGNRSYVTVAVGCTGGQHRSVYLAERLAEHFRTEMDNVLVSHRELQA